jgi:hypothetical protein
MQGTHWDSVQKQRVNGPEAEFIHVRTISLRFLGIILRVLRLEAVWIS